MTLTQLVAIRHFLTRIVVRGTEEQELIELINSLDRLIAHHKAA